MKNVSSMQSSPDYPESPDLEVLICTHDRQELLQRVLASLNLCRRPANCRIGVFVVANACTDATDRALESYVRSADQNNGRLPLRWMIDPIPGKSHALNTALPLAKAPLIAFVDDDHRVDVGYLEAVWRAAQEQPAADFFCGRILPDWDGSEPAWVHDQGRYRIYPLPVPRFDLGDSAGFVEPGSSVPGGGNLAIRGSVFARVGPFNLELGPRGHDLGGAEDIEWVRRGVADGAKVYYTPEMLQYHYVDSKRMTLAYVMQKAYERSASTARLLPSFETRRSLPLYLIRKTLAYALQAMVSLSSRRRRFYLTRLSAALGEIKGFHQQKKSRAARGQSNVPR